MSPKAIVSGLVFGLLVGFIMVLPGAGFVVSAYAVNLSVMGALWLGAALAQGQDQYKGVQEVAVAVVTFVIAGAVFQSSPNWLYAGFALQAIWSFVHHDGRRGVAVISWYPAFSAMANAGFIISFFILSQTVGGSF